MDIIVLNGYYSFCEGCFVPNKNNTSIKSIHPEGEIKEKSVLLAFEVSKTSGRFKSINPKKYKWNNKLNKLIDN